MTNEEYIRVLSKEDLGDFINYLLAVGRWQQRRKDEKDNKFFTPFDDVNKWLEMEYNEAIPDPYYVACSGIKRYEGEKKMHWEGIKKWQHKIYGDK